MLSKIKISFFLPSLRGGGAERVFVNLANEFARRNFDVDLVLAQKEGPYLEEISNKVKIVELKKKRILLCLFSLMRYLREKKPAILFCAMFHVNIIGYLAKYLTHSDTKIVATEHNSFSITIQQLPAIKKIILSLLVRILYPKMDKIIAVSKGVAEDLMQVVQLPKNKLQVIYNPVIKKAEILRKSQEIPSHPFFREKRKKGMIIIIGIGRLTKQKDFPTLLKAFGKIKKHKDARLIILGEGEERIKLEGLIKKLNLSSFVSLPGFVKNPYSYLKNSDLFVLSSKWEGLPTVLIEALACGIPVVSTDCPSGPREILEEGKYGKLVPVGDWRALAEAILETLDNPPDPEKLKERANFFSIERAGREYFELINSLVLKK